MAKTTRMLLLKTGTTLAAGVLAALLAACSSEGSRSSGSLTAADFRAADADRAPEPVAMSERRAPALRTETVEPEDTPDVTVLEGAPKLDPVPATPTGRADTAPVMMDSLIGDINGTPIYAMTFFTPPIEARLTGMAANPKLDKEAWTSETRKIIAVRLGDMVRDEVLLAEARSSLTPEQKQGLLSFIDQVRRDLVSSGGGGQAAVDESLREQGEGGLDAKLKENIDKQLIYSKLREKILPRATVSWHEVQVEYERRAEKFNPDPTAKFRVIRVSSKNTALVEEIKSAIAGGTSFAEVAERPENDFPSGGTYEQVFKGEYSKAPLFGIKELNTAAQALQPGGVAGPIVFGEYTGWVQLEANDTPRAMSIYEAQLAIYNELREKKVKVESDKYMANLLNRQSYSELNQMGEKLLRIATERYYTRDQ